MTSFLLQGWLESEDNDAVLAGALQPTKSDAEEELARGPFQVYCLFESFNRFLKDQSVMLNVTESELGRFYQSSIT